MKKILLLTLFCMAFAQTGCGIETDKKVVADAQLLKDYESIIEELDEKIASIEIKAEITPIKVVFMSVQQYVLVVKLTMQPEVGRSDVNTTEIYDKLDKVLIKAVKGFEDYKSLHYYINNHEGNPIGMRAGTNKLKPLTGKTLQD